jgi:hypothetical protein
VKIVWRLRMAAAQREVWTGAQLRRLLAERAGLELSAASVSALLTKEPSQVTLQPLPDTCSREHGRFGERFVGGDRDAGFLLALGENLEQHFGAAFV